MFAMLDLILGWKGSGQLSDKICATSSLRGTADIYHPLPGRGEVCLIKSEIGGMVRKPGTGKVRSGEYGGNKVVTDHCIGQEEVVCSKSQSGSLGGASDLCLFPRNLQIVVDTRVGTVIVD